MNEVTVAQMKELERAADAAGLSYRQMMENAGAAAVDVLLQEKGTPETVYVFCGKGNNGGDGFVAARLLHERGARVTAVLVQGEPAAPDAAENYVRCRKCGVRMTQLDALSNEDLCALEQSCVIDAVYGTGFHGEMRPEGKRAAQRINSGRFVLALDVPSGVAADTGAAAQGAVRAHVTVTFHAPKVCHRIAAAWCGRVVTAEIGITGALQKG